VSSGHTFRKRGGCQVQVPLRVPRVDKSCFRRVSFVFGAVVRATRPVAQYHLRGQRDRVRVVRCAFRGLQHSSGRAEGKPRRVLASTVDDSPREPISQTLVRLRTSSSRALRNSRRRSSSSFMEFPRTRRQPVTAPAGRSHELCHRVHGCSTNARTSIYGCLWAVIDILHPPEGGGIPRHRTAGLGY